MLAAASQGELKEVFDYAIETPGCVYFRVPMVMPERIEYDSAPAAIDQPRVVREGSNGLVIATGSMVARAHDAVKKLAAEGTDLGLVNLTLLDPVPADALAEIMKNHKKIATVEEHFVTGGLGSIVADVIAADGLGCRLHKIGVDDAYPDRYTTCEENLAYIGLDRAGIAAKLKEFF